MISNDRRRLFSLQSNITVIDQYQQNREEKKTTQELNWSDTLYSVYFQGHQLNVIFFA
jgi:hypothetical protein